MIFMLLLFYLFMQFSYWGFLIFIAGVFGFFILLMFVRSKSVTAIKMIGYALFITEYIVVAVTIFYCLINRNFMAIGGIILYLIWLTNGGKRWNLPFVKE